MLIDGGQSISTPSKRGRTAAADVHRNLRRALEALPETSGDGPTRRLAELAEEYGIPSRYLRGVMSPWAAKRLAEFGGDITQFRVVKIYPSLLNQIAVAKTEPGDENNQDISALVGKVDIRMLEHFAQNDADAYSYSGALCRGNQGLMEFVEMAKESNVDLVGLSALLTTTMPFMKEIVSHFAGRNDVKVVIGTHPIPEKYLDMHTKLGTWNSKGWEKILAPTMANEETRLKYN